MECRPIGFDLICCHCDRFGRNYQFIIRNDWRLWSQKGRRLIRNETGFGELIVFWRTGDFSFCHVNGIFGSIRSSIGLSSFSFFFCSFIFYCYFIFDWVWFVFACVCVCVLLLLLLLLLLWGNCNSWERVTWIFMSAAPTNRVRVVIEPSNGGSSFLAFESKDRNRHLWKTCPCFVAFYFFFCFLFLFFFFFFFFFFFVFVFTFPFSSFAFFDSVSLRRVDMRCTYVASTEMNLRRLLWGAVVCDVGLLSCYFRSCFKSDCFSFKMRLFSRTQGHFINWMALNMMSPM